MTFRVDEKPLNAFRITLTLASAKRRLDQVLIEELRKQSQSLVLKNISRSEFKELFKKKKIRIKGQNALPSSALAGGVTIVDILGYGVEDSKRQ
jgi:hypothetical protein